MTCHPERVVLRRREGVQTEGRIRYGGVPPFSVPRIGHSRGWCPDPNLKNRLWKGIVGASSVKTSFMVALHIAKSKSGTRLSSKSNQQPATSPPYPWPIAGVDEDGAPQEWHVFHRRDGYSTINNVGGSGGFGGSGRCSNRCRRGITSKSWSVPAGVGATDGVATAATARAGGAVQNLPAGQRPYTASRR